MKIYTKTGDKGNTSLIGGMRVTKNDVRVEAYGTIDELISITAVLRDTINDVEQISFLIKIQDKLMICASLFACQSEEQWINLPTIENEDILILENRIDEMEKQIPILNSFILPGGNLSSSYSHFARSICRRAERRVISISEPINDNALIYLNRLSDFYFVYARFLIMKSDAIETLWAGNIKK